MDDNKFVKNPELIIGVGILLVLASFFITPIFVANHFSPDGILEERTIQLIPLVRFFAVVSGIFAVVFGALIYTSPSAVNRFFDFVSLRVERFQKRYSYLPFCFACFFIALTLLIVSYNRFLIYHEIYHPLLKLAWNPSLFPGDMIRDSFFLEVLGVFFTLLEYLAPIARYLGEENLLFLIFITINILNTFVCYKIAMLFGSKKLSVLFIVIMFNHFSLLTSAGVSIIIIHHFFATGVAMLFVFLSFYFYFSKRHFLCFMALAITCLLHIKTGFAIAVPLGICLVWDLFDFSLDRKKIIRSILFAAPVFILVALFYLSLTLGFQNCDDLIQIWLGRLGSEYDILKIKILPVNYNYCILNVMAIYLCFRYTLSNHIGRRVFRLIIAANIGLLIGTVFSIIHNYITPVNTLMLFAWPRIGMVATFASILIICYYLMLYDSTWSMWHSVVTCILIFITLNSYQFLTGIILLQALMAFVLFVSAILFIGHAKIKNARVLVASVIILCLVFGHAFVFYQVIQQKRNLWVETVYRTPSSFNPFEYEATKWLNTNACEVKMTIYPVRDKGTVEYSYMMMKYSERPWFFYDDIRIVYGSCSMFEEYKRRRSILEQWVITKDMQLLSESNVGYIVIRKTDKDFFLIPDNMRVYENEKMIIYDIAEHDES